MSLAAFTSKGVEEKITELYALSNAALSLQASYIKTDFRQWMKDNFTLSADQRNYLDGLGDAAVSYYGNECAFCFLNRLPIVLVQPDPVPGYAKWTVASNTIQVAADQNGAVSASGTLTFTIEYMP